jgi:hypothetical protein
MKKERFCAGCGKKIPWDHCALGTGDKTICTNCEGASITVFKVSIDGSHYIDRDVNGVKVILDNMEDDDVHTVSRVKMRLTEYLSLPEFDGF